MKLTRLTVIASLAFVATIVSTSASTFNFRNGYIAVTNSTSGVIHVSILHRDEWGIIQHDTANFNDCCYLAGSTYLVTARLSGRTAFFESHVTPRLCSKNASPYGYAHLVVHDDGRIVRVDTRCP